MLTHTQKQQHSIKRELTAITLMTIDCYLEGFL